MRILPAIAAFLVSVVLSPGAGTNTVAPTTSDASAALKIGAPDAAKYYDQTMTVTGRVAQVTIRPTVTFLNLDKAYPNSPCAVVIFHGHSGFYGDANALKGKSIEITGKVKNYRDKPEIALDELKQLKVFDEAGKDITSAILNSTNAPPAKPVQVPPAGTSTNLPEIM